MQRDLRKRIDLYRFRGGCQSLVVAAEGFERHRAPVAYLAVARVDGERSVVELERTLEVARERFGEAGGGEHLDLVGCQFPRLVERRPGLGDRLAHWDIAIGSVPAAEKERRDRHVGVGGSKARREGRRLAETCDRRLHRSAVPLVQLVPAQQVRLVCLGVGGRADLR